MLDFIFNLASFALALGILVTVHEYGHFWVARKAGVKVLRFSIGFGKPLLRWHDKQGTEFVIAAIPLGGYVKMLDERVEAVPEAEKHLAFNRKPVTARIAVVAAGPIANFLFAIVVLAVMYLVGVQSVKPVIGQVAEQSIAAKSGLQPGEQITAINGEEIHSWRDVTLSLMDNLGEQNVTFAVKPVQSQTLEGTQSALMNSGSARTVTVNLSDWTLDDSGQSPINSIGITPFSPEPTLTLALVQADSAAANAGLEVNDTIVALNGEPVSSWQALVAEVQNSANQALTLTISRDGEERLVTVTPKNRPTPDGFSQGYLGVSPSVPAWPEGFVVTQQYGPLDAVGLGVEKTWQLITLSFEMIGNLLTGQVSVKNLSGPVGIAVGAGTSVSYGLVAFLSFLALISVNLGVFNLLPLPILDGGHLMYYLIELIRKKPVSEKTQEIGFRIGALILLLLTSFALLNDFTRL